MRTLRIVTIGIGLLLVSATLASAQATRTWVSGVGDDANPCSRTAPCKTFAGAISKTAAGGEISVEPGSDRDVLIEQRDDTLGETRSIWFDVRHAETVCAAILAQARAIKG